MKIVSVLSSHRTYLHSRTWKLVTWNMIRGSDTCFLVAFSFVWKKRKMVLGCLLLVFLQLSSWTTFTSNKPKRVITSQFSYLGELPDYFFFSELFDPVSFGRLRSYFERLCTTCNTRSIQSTTYDDNAPGSRLYTTTTVPTLSVLRSSDLLPEYIGQTYEPFMILNSASSSEGQTLSRNAMSWGIRVQGWRLDFPPASHVLFH